LLQQTVAYSQLAVVNNGRIGIGINTVPDTYKMYVKGESNVAAAFSVTHSKPWGWAEISLVNTSNVKSWIVDYNGSHQYFVNSNGQMYSNGSYLTPDIKFKRDVQPMELGLQKLKLLKPVSFYRHADFKSDKSSPSLNYGFIAQEVRASFPYLTKYAYHDADKTDSSLYVNYDMILPIVVQAVQEQQQMIDSLKETIQELVEKTEQGNYSSNEPTVIVVPNPNSGIFSVQINGVYQPVKVMVTNLLGEYIYDGRKTDTAGDFAVDLSNKPKGIYIVNVHDGARIIASRKVIVE
jgi:hypothetical protein